MYEFLINFADNAIMEMSNKNLMQSLHRTMMSGLEIYMNLRDLIFQEDGLTVIEEEQSVKSLTMGDNQFKKAIQGKNDMFQLDNIKAIINEKNNLSNNFQFPKKINTSIEESIKNEEMAYFSIAFYYNTLIKKCNFFLFFEI